MNGVLIARDQRMPNRLLYLRTMLINAFAIRTSLEDITR